MPKIVYKKKWIRFTHDELVEVIKEHFDALSSNDFVITNVDTGQKDHYSVEHVTFAIALRKDE